VKTARSTDWEGAILFAYSTGARLSDVANLRWENVDPVVGVVVFRQRKTSRETIVGLHADFADWLLRGTAPDDLESFVFPRLANRPVGGKRGLSSEFSALLDRAGIEAGQLRQKHGIVGRSRRNLSFHSLRHTAVSLAYNASAVREVARQISAHAEHGSLDRYLHVDLSVIKSATSLIPRLPLVS
jgi:integrase